MWRPVGPRGSHPVGDVVVEGACAPPAAVMVVDARLHHVGNQDDSSAGPGAVEDGNGDDAAASLEPGVPAFVFPHGFAYRWHQGEDMTDPSSLSFWWPRAPEGEPCLVLPTIVCRGVLTPVVALFGVQTTWPWAALRCWAAVHPRRMPVCACTSRWFTVVACERGWRWRLPLSRPSTRCRASGECATAAAPSSCPAWQRLLLRSQPWSPHRPMKRVWAARKAPPTRRAAMPKLMQALR